MSVAITLLGREFHLAPYKLGQMIEAAPILDAQQARSTRIAERAGVAFLPTDPADERLAKSARITAAMTTAEALAEAADAVRILHIGIARIDPSITIEHLLDGIEASVECIGAVIAAMSAVLGLSGLIQGEAAAPAPETYGTGA